MTTLMNPRLREREYIFAIGRALMNETEINEVLRVILHAVTDLVSSKVGVVIMAEPEEEAFRVVATYGMPSRVLNKFTPLVQGVPYSHGRIREALDEVKEAVKAMARETDATLLKSLGLPMYSGDTIIGAIFVFHAHQYTITDSLARFLQSFATWAAIAVKNARLYEANVAEKQRLNAIIQQSADGVMIIDQSLHIATFNAALTHMMGIPSHKAIGQLHDAVLKLEHLRTETDLEEALANGWPLHGGKHLYVEGDYRRKDGQKVALGITYAPLINERNKMTNIIANVRDLTRYREEEKLHKTFISVVGHELKTPVAIIKGYAGTLQREDVEWPRETLVDYLTTIEEEADSLTDLIDNLLEASRLQSGTFVLDIHNDISISSLARNIGRKFQQQTAKHTLVVDFPAYFPEVAADERRLTQVFNNLVSNAIKYSPDGGTITIRGREIDNHVVVSILDSGIGIPQHQRHRIFQQFSRLDNALSRKTEGTGLGLFLTKAIIEAHHGQIWFENNPDGEGTIFSFSLPLRDA
jgi:PAS domain S-box-containing protein